MNKHLKFIISLFVVPLPGMGVDAYAPSLPEVAAYFHSSVFLTQLSIPFYTLGYALSMLVSGVIVDNYGTRKLTIISLLTFAFLSASIIFAPNMECVIVLRLLQGLSVGFFAVSVRATVIALYAHDQIMLRSKVNIMQIAWSMGPILAPAIGGFLGHHFGWQSSFILMAAYSLIMGGVVTLFYSESPAKKVSTFDFTAIKNSYTTILSNTNFLLGFIAMGTLYAVAISFNTVGSFILHSLGASSIMFGCCSLLLGCAWLCGSMANKMITSISLERKLLLAAGAIVIISIATMLVSKFYINLWTLMAAAVSLNLCAGMVYSGLYIVTLSRFPHLPGNSSGLMSSGILFTCALGTSVLSKIIPHNLILPFLNADLALNLISVTLVVILFHRQVIFHKIRLIVVK